MLSVRFALITEIDISTTEDRETCSTIMY